MEDQRRSWRDSSDGLLVRGIMLLAFFLLGMVASFAWAVVRDSFTDALYGFAFLGASALTAVLVAYEWKR